MKVRTIISLLAIFAVAFLVIGAGCKQETQETGSAVQTFEPQTHSIDIIDFAFSPQVLTISIGDTVVWTNKDNIRHDIKSNDGNFYSIPLETGEMYAFTFNQAGTFKYRCGLHPTMEGTIIVE